MRNNTFELTLSDLRCLNIEDVYCESSTAIELVADMVHHVDRLGISGADLSITLSLLLGIQKASARQIQANFKAQINAG